jgi:hypothetical protein
MSDLIEALCRAKVEAVYKRQLTEEEWQKRRENSMHPLDQWIVLAVARVVVERCARVVEEGQETFSSSRTEERHYLSPRRKGNLAGLAYAEAIHALIPEEEKGTADAGQD